MCPSFSSPEGGGWYGNRVDNAASYDLPMQVLAPPEVVEYVRERGGQLYVWTFKGG